MPDWLTRARLRLAGVVVGAAALWVIGLVWFRPWIAHDDFAIFRIALERELDGHVRLVGAHSRLGVFHPGPLREWVFALPYWAGGRRSASLPATALLLNAGWVVWTLVVLARLRPRRWGVVGALGLVLLVVALGADMASPWNPHLAVLPAYLACWSLVTIIARAGTGWVACLVAASFAAQMHASMLIVGGVVLAAALTSIAWRRRRRTTVAAGGLALLLWSGPIVDLRHGSGANLIRLGTVGADGDPVGLGAAAGHVSRLLWPFTPWRRISVRPSIVEFAGFHRWWLLLVVLVPALLAMIELRRADPSEPVVAGGERDRLPVAASTVALAVVVLSIVSVSFFVEPAYRYLYGPLQAPAVFALAVAVGGVATVMATWVTVPQRGAVTVVPAVFAAAVVGATLVVFVSVPRQDGPSVARRALGVEGAVSSALAARPGWRSVEAVPLDLQGAGDLDAEVLDVALRRGIDARSRRTELGLAAPERVDGVFGVAMAPARDCLLAEDDAEEIVRGTSDAGEIFSVIALDRDSVAYDRCIGLPVD